LIRFYFTQTIKVLQTLERRKIPKSATWFPKREGLRGNYYRF
jgi:hypothetical protein